MKSLRTYEESGKIHIGEAPFLKPSARKCPHCGKQLEINTVTQFLCCDADYGEGRCGQYYSSVESFIEKYEKEKANAD